MTAMSPTTELGMSSPRESTSIAQSSEPQQPQGKIFEQLRAYPFSTDREFATGLAIILGHPETPVSKEEIARDDDLVLQAKCYYFTRKENLTSSLNATAYKSWLEAIPTIDASKYRKSPTELTSTSTGPSATSLPPSSGITDQQDKPVGQGPLYPTSFAHIVELITTSQHVPGIQQVPDTLLTGQGTQSVKPRRLKPWEKQKAV
ncbi:hypothetical protein BJX70DRAFT_392074 [Aspergillus crustosus]